MVTSPRAYHSGKMQLNGDVTMTSRFFLAPPMECTSSFDPVHQVWDRSRDWCVRHSRYNSGKMELNGDVTMTSRYLPTPPVECTSSNDLVHQIWDRSSDWCVCQSRYNSGLFPIVNCIDSGRHPCPRGGLVAKYVKL